MANLWRTVDSAEGSTPVHAKSTTTATGSPQTMSTPSLSTRDTIALLRSLASAVESGLGILAFLQNDAATAALKPMARDRLRARIEQGGTLTSALQSLGSLDKFALALIQAGEQAGAIDRSLMTVVGILEERRAARRRLVAGFAYPILLLFIAGTVLPLPLIFTAGFGAYLAVAIWMPCFLAAAVVFFGVVVPRQGPDSMLRRLPTSIGFRMPVVRGALRRRGQGFFARVLGRCVESGVPMSDSIRAAASASGSDRLELRAGAIVSRLEAGASLVDALRVAGFFDQRFLATIAQGELAGNLDKTCDVLARDETEASARLLGGVTKVAIGVVLGLVFVAVGFGVVRGFLGYVEALDGIMEGI